MEGSISIGRLYISKLGLFCLLLNVHLIKHALIISYYLYGNIYRSLPLLKGAVVLHVD
jgi:hypothetical protein